MPVVLVRGLARDGGAPADGDIPADGTALVRPEDEDLFR